MGTDSTLLPYSKPSPSQCSNPSQSQPTKLYSSPWPRSESTDLVALDASSSEPPLTRAWPSLPLTILSFPLITWSTCSSTTPLMASSRERSVPMETNLSSTARRSPCTARGILLPSHGERMVLNTLSRALVSSPPSIRLVPILLVAERRSSSLLLLLVPLCSSWG